jgi:hypothetical protein
MDANRFKRPQWFKDMIWRERPRFENEFIWTLTHFLQNQDGQKNVDGNERSKRFMNNTS